MSPSRKETNRENKVVDKESGKFGAKVSKELAIAKEKNGGKAVCPIAMILTVEVIITSSDLTALTAFIALTAGPAVAGVAFWGLEAACRAEKGSPLLLLL